MASLSAWEATLRQSRNEWEWKVAQLIQDETVPSGHLITYGRLAEIANRRYGLSISPRNVANLRRKLYSLLSHQTDVPLHRIAKKGDVQSLADSPTTRRENNRRRGAEGSLVYPMWV